MSCPHCAALREEIERLKADLDLAYNPPEFLTLKAPIPLKERATPYETWLLNILHRRMPNWVDSRSITAMFDELAETLGKPIPGKNLVRVRVHYLRRKLTPAHKIEGRFGVGYRLIEPL